MVYGLHEIGDSKVVSSPNYIAIGTATCFEVDRFVST